MSKLHQPAAICLILLNDSTQRDIQHEQKQFKHTCFGAGITPGKYLKINVFLLDFFQQQKTGPS